MKKQMWISLLALTLILATLGGCASSGGSTSQSWAPSGTGQTSSGAPFPGGDPSGIPGGYTWDSDYYPAPGEQYLDISENERKDTSREPMLTFSLKVDTASYSNVQRYLNNGQRPPADAVRTEELLNYFSYDIPMRFGADPFSVYTEIGPSPFDANKYMAFIRVKTPDIDRSNLAPSNLIFLIDTSGSMNSYDKLPLLQDAFAMLVDTLTENDKVSIVTYAGSAGVVLDSASGNDKDRILRAIQSLRASGSTAGAQGIQTAYELAEKNFMHGGNNRVILASDGDFNVGMSNVNDLERFIADKRASGVYLSVLGFGTGNIRDDIMETLAKSGNGNYFYINDQTTARKVLVDELTANLYTIADDVKAQVEFNAQNVKSYRLIGYENRQLSNRDFNDDTKDAGEIGVGTDVVMMFELELFADGAGLKYGDAPAPSSGQYGDELFEVRVRYKDPGQTESKLLVKPVTFETITSSNSSDFQFACSVAAFGHLLRQSPYTGSVTIDDVYGMARGNLGEDRGGYRTDYIRLIEQYRALR